MNGRLCVPLIGHIALYNYKYRRKCEKKGAMMSPEMIIMRNDVTSRQWNLNKKMYFKKMCNLV